MRLLDIDMDFFQSEIHTNDTDSNFHLEDDDFKVWTEEDFVDFLENKCGLSKKDKIKGRIFNHHVETYWFAKELIDKRLLSPPFEITHIDAHSDMGFSMSVPYYVFLDTFSKENKAAFENGTLFENAENLRYIDFGNYINAMALNRWLSKIEYVYHDKMDYLDVPEYIVERDKTKKGFAFRYNFINQAVIPDLTIYAKNKENYQSIQPYDYICVAISPAYTVKEIEPLVEIIKQYIIEI